MQIGYSSLGAPQLGLVELRHLALRHALDFVELRTVGGTIDLPAMADQGALHAAASGRPPIRLVASNLQLLQCGGEGLASFLRYAAVADRCGAPFIRVFSGGEVGQQLEGEDFTKVATAIGQCRRELAAQSLHCEMLLETHFSFSSAKFCRALNERLDAPIHILWDCHHTWRRGGESPAEAWDLLGPWVRHIHYKDSVMAAGSPADGTYVIPGTGEFPTSELVSVLRRGGYEGGLSLEWEKLWHPELPEISAALEAFVGVTAGL